MVRRNRREDEGAAFRTAPSIALLHLLGGLVVDGLERVVNAAALGDRRELRDDGGVDLGGEGAVVDRRNLRLPIGEIGPDRLAAKEGVRRLVGVASAGSEPGAV